MIHYCPLFQLSGGGGRDLDVLAELFPELLLGCAVTQLGCLGFLLHELPTFSRRAQADWHPRGKGSKRRNRIKQSLLILDLELPQCCIFFISLVKGSHKVSWDTSRAKAKRCCHLCKELQTHTAQGGGHRESITGVVCVCVFNTGLPHMLSFYQYIVRRTNFHLTLLKQIYVLDSIQSFSQCKGKIMTNLFLCFLG